MQASERDGEEMNGTHLAVLIIGIIFGWLIRDSISKEAISTRTRWRRDVHSKTD
jgi:hypothetical protein